MAFLRLLEGFFKLGRLGKRTSRGCTNQVTFEDER